MTHIYAPTVLAFCNGRVRDGASRLAEEVVSRPGGLAGREVHLDFGNVEFVESRDLGALVVLNRKVKGAGGKLALVNVRPVVSGVLEVTRLNTILEVRKEPVER